ncbi:hypothetical protein HPB52_006549 [Rhipicephalus sanguineus]|uniref:Large ribosomal subunit protein eL18 n=1 Tax=Rhipicephalus sanguineus TaxID=34632 RepID=A0A9D4SRM2_RHISA|nr:hypothetical protein HPB52_006549 [Rhipicephalus sanguineus]
MGIDICHKYDRKVRRTRPKSENVYLGLLVKVYRFLARRTNAKFNKIVLRRLHEPHQPAGDVSRSRGPLHEETGREGLIAVIVGTVTDDLRIYEVPKLRFFHAIEMPGDSRLKPSTQRAFGSRKKRAWNKKAPATSAPSAAELESRRTLGPAGTSMTTRGTKSTSETLRVDAAYYSTAEQAQRVERSAQTKTVLSGKSANQRKFDLLGAGGEILTFDELAVKAPKGKGTVLMQGPRNAARPAALWTGSWSSHSHTKPYVRSKGRKYERAGRRKSRGYKA